MKIGKATVPRTAICTSDEHTIVVRGARPLEGPDRQGLVHRPLLPAAHRPACPTAGEAAVLNATLVAIAEHGLVPSVQAARMTFAAAPDAMQGAVAAGILGCGSVILGASETAGRMYMRDRRQGRGRKRVARRRRARGRCSAWRAAGKPIPGYGHPLHKERDPRVGALFAVAREAGTDLRFVAIAEAVEACCPRCSASRPASSTSRRDPRGAARRRLSGGGAARACRSWRAPPA